MVRLWVMRLGVFADPMHWASIPFAVQSETRVSGVFPRHVLQVPMTQPERTHLLLYRLVESKMVNFVS